jgi:hypothetical protein
LANVHVPRLQASIDLEVNEAHERLPRPLERERLPELREELLPEEVLLPDERFEDPPDEPFVVRLPRAEPRFEPRFDPRFVCRPDPVEPPALPPVSSVAAAAASSPVCPAACCAAWPAWAA